MITICVKCQVCKKIGVITNFDKTMPQSDFWPFGSKLLEDCNNGEASVLVRIQLVEQVNQANYILKIH